MKKKILKLAAVSALMLILSATAGMAQEAFNHGFGNRSFLIQSAPEVGKSANGFWDIPGTPKKTDGNFKKPKGGKWLQIQLWQIGARNDEDRLYKFRPGRGNATGRYFISIGLSGNWGVKVIDGTGKIEAREHDEDHFELKHMGNGRWKIYYKNGMIVAPAAKSAKNGTKLVLLPDQNSLHVQWVFLDPARKIPFKPFEPKPEQPKVSSNPDFMIKNKDKALNYKADTMVSNYTGTAYIAYINYKTAYICTTSTGINPNTNKKETKSGMIRIAYNEKTGEYFDNINEPDFRLTGKADASGMVLGLSNDGGVITFEATDKAKSAVIPKNPEFFIKNKKMTFVFKGESAFGSGSTGTAIVKSVKGNEVTLSVKRSRKDEQSGKVVTSTGDYKLYYMNGYYTNNNSDYMMWGVAAETSRELEIHGEQNNDTFTVK